MSIYFRNKQRRMQKMTEIERTTQYQAQQCSKNGNWKALMHLDTLKFAQHIQVIHLSKYEKRFPEIKYRIIKIETIKSI